MATRKKKKPSNPYIARALSKTARGAISGSLGVTVGIVEEAVSEEAGAYLTAAMTAIGFIGSVLTDPVSNPNWSDGFDSTFKAGTTMGGRKFGHSLTKVGKEVAHKRNMDRLRADMIDEGFVVREREEPAHALEPEAVPVPIPRQRNTDLTPKNGQIAEI